MAAPGRPPKTPINPQYPNRLREVRVNRGLSRDAVAEVLHIDPSSAGRYERGEQQLGINQLAALSRALRVPVGDFFPPNPEEVVDVIGEIHADGAIRPFSDGRVRAVESPGGMDPRLTRAAQIRDRAFFPLEDGVVVYFEEIAQPYGPEIDKAVHRLVVLQQFRGAPLMIGQLHLGRDDSYMLLGPRGILVEGGKLESISVVRALHSPDSVRWVDATAFDNRYALSAPAAREAAEDAAKTTHKLRRSS